MKGLFCVFISGIIFAIGLGLSGMTDANKVIGFLNVAGSWDPALAFVMVGAIGAHLATFKLVTGRQSPLFASKFHLPTKHEINTKLAVGSSLFGIGWGLGGRTPTHPIRGDRTQSTQSLPNFKGIGIHHAIINIDAAHQ